MRRSALGPTRCVLEQFKETPIATQILCAFYALEHSNARGRGCCPYHIGVASLIRNLQEMGRHDCVPDYSPLGSWQCTQCLATNSDAGHEAEPEQAALPGASSPNDSIAHMECEVCGSTSVASGPPA